MHCIVTGAGGFLGRYIVEQLLARGDAVRGLARGEYPELSAAGVEMVRGDLSDRSSVVDACRGVDCVFHVGGKVGVWGRAFDYVRANVQGTLNVIAACGEHGVGRLVFTSSPSVTFDATSRRRAHQRGLDEASAPYPTRWLAHYPHSKALAEQFVLTANGQGGLQTCSLRPHLVWGPRDTNLTARLWERARAGNLRRVGDGKNRVDQIYVENAAEAHLLAADALAEPNSPAAGNAYFLSQGEPVDCWQWIDELLALADLPPVERSVSSFAAYTAGWAMETAYWLRGRYDDEPPMTRFVARSLSTDHWFDIGAARRDFGYDPRVSTSDGMERLRGWLAAKAECGMGNGE